jgi:methionine-rich copper-binding protein CopC
MTLSLALRAAGFGLAAAAFSLTAAYAAAGPLQVVSRSPTKNSFSSFPKSIHLTFNEPLKATGADVQLMDPDGRRIRVSAPVDSKDGLTVTPALSGGPPVLGPYMLTWQANSASGDAGKGDYTFFVQ